MHNTIITSYFYKEHFSENPNSPHTHTQQKQQNFTTKTMIRTTFLNNMF